MDNDITIKPQVGLDVVSATEEIVALRRYLEATGTHRLLENLTDLGEE